MKIGFYCHGKNHTIEKYFQIFEILNRMINDDRFTPVIALDSDCIASQDIYNRYAGRVDIFTVDSVNTIDGLGLSAFFNICPYSKPSLSYKDTETPMIYKEYGVAGVEAGTGYLVSRPSYRYADLIITESQFTKSQITDKYPDKEVIVGSPAFDFIFDNNYRKVVEESRRGDEIPVLWTPHHSVMSEDSFDKIEGGVYSTFVEFKDYLTGRFLDDFPQTVLHIKYHPILGRRYNKMCRTLGVDDSFGKFLRSVRNNPRIVVHDREDFHLLFAKTCICLNDSISFLQEYLPTFCPMIVLESQKKSKYSSFGEKIIDDCYERAEGPEDLREKFSKIMSGQFDFEKLSARTDYVNSLYIKPGLSNSRELLNIIYERYSK